jgi:hypothetical protein
MSPPDNAVFTPTPPRVRLTCRVFHNTLGYLLNVLLPSWRLFWPDKSVWPDTSMVLIWDAESKLDRAVSQNLSGLYPEVYHIFEEEAPHYKRVFEDCARAPGAHGKAKIPGYQRQMFSNYIQDEQPELTAAFPGEGGPPDFFGFVDSDSFFTAAVHPDELFVHKDGRWLPRVLMYNGCCIGWNENTRLALGGAVRHERPGDPWIMGEGWPRVGEGMIGLNFPILVRPSHLPAMRSFVAKTASVTRNPTDLQLSFGEAIRRLCIESETDKGRDTIISQFDVISNFLYISPIHRRLPRRMHLLCTCYAHAMRMPIHAHAHTDTRTSTDSCTCTCRHTSELTAVSMRGSSTTRTRDTTRPGASGRQMTLASWPLTPTSPTIPGLV